MSLIRTYGPGVLFAFVIALVANVVGRWIPILGGSVLAIVLGMLINQVVTKPAYLHVGIAFTSKKGLQYAIILLGTSYHFSAVISVGKESLLLLISVFLTAFVATYVFGQLLKVDSHLNILIGVGTAICGGTAIAATAPILKAKSKDVFYAISTIFLFNILAVISYPLIGHIFGMADGFFGQWAGASINDTSSVVAAGFAYSDAAGQSATIVKLARTLMILPVTAFVAIIETRKNQKQYQSESKFSLITIFPWFILFFFMAVSLNSLGFLPVWLTNQASSLGKFLIVMALASVGLNTNIKQMSQTGFKPLILGMLVWFSVVTVSISVLMWLQ